MPGEEAVPHLLHTSEHMQEQISQDVSCKHSRHSLFSCMSSHAGVGISVPDRARFRQLRRRFTMAVADVLGMLQRELRMRFSHSRSMFQLRLRRRAHSSVLLNAHSAVTARWRGHGLLRARIRCVRHLFAKKSNKRTNSTQAYDQ